MTIFNTKIAAVLFGIKQMLLPCDMVSMGLEINLWAAGSQELMLKAKSRLSLFIIGGNRPGGSSHQHLLLH